MNQTSLLLSGCTVPLACLQSSFVITEQSVKVGKPHCQECHTQCWVRRNKNVCGDTAKAQ